MRYQTPKSVFFSHRYVLIAIIMMLSLALVNQNPLICLGAEAEPSLLMGACQIASGETGVVTITAQNIPDPGLAGYQLTVQYDPEKIEVLGLQKTASDAFAMQIPNYDIPGTVRLAAVQTNGVKGDFTIARILIKAKSSASGSADLNLTINQLVLADLQILQAQAVKGQVTFSTNSIKTAEPQSPLTISIVNLPEAIVNQPYSCTLKANNGNPPYSWSATGLPDGLTLNSQTGEISGIPSAKAESSFVQISVSDTQTSSQPVTAQFALQVINQTSTNETTSSNATTGGTTTNGTTSGGSASSSSLSGVPTQNVSVPTSTISQTSRIAGNTAAQTAVQIAEQTGWKGTAILASSETYGMVDALTAGPLAAYVKAPILLTESGNKLNSNTKAELKKLEVKTVYVTSGTGVISQAILDELTGMGINVVTLGGSDRFATSVNIARKMVELGAPMTKVAVAYGWKSQDALSIAPIASAQSEPILLTERDNLPADVKSFLSANGTITSTDVIGGTGVISEAAKALLPNPTRYAGITAYDTNTQVIKSFDSAINYDDVYLANGETAIDALAGVPLAAKNKSAIILTNQVSPAAATFVKTRLGKGSVITALGGAAVVPNSVVTGLTQ